jgi:PH (Pleckstrin Homology) domain-containing protein
VVRLPGNDQVPPEAYRYLLPHERRVFAVRRHPAVLAIPLGFLASAVIAASLLTATGRKDISARRGAWGVSGVSGVAIFVSAIRLYAWLNSYVVVTDTRLLYVKSLASVKVNAIRLSEVRTVDLHRSLLGRLLGYGTFVIKSSGPDEKIRFLPYPEQLYLEVYGTLAREDDDED